jgi:hypothetical protein
MSTKNLEVGSFTGGGTKKNTRKHFLLPLILLPSVTLIIVTFVAVSCTLVSPKKGTLLLDIDPGFQISTLLPDVDMTPTQYDFHGDGPNGSSFDVSDDQLPVLKYGLDYGDWTITVNAKNVSNTIVARGSETTTINTGNAKTVQVKIKPVSGYGTLDLTVLWNDADVDIPSVMGQLVLNEGAPIDLAFTIPEPGKALYSNDSIPTGYYTMTVQLYDNGLLVMGAVEVVRIVNGNTTSGVFEFYDINKPGGDLSISLSLEMDDPLTVNLSGQQPEITEGDTMTVSASIVEDVGNVVFIWYINGESKFTGETYSFGSYLPAGFYRLDVTAFTADGTRAGSEVHNFSILEPPQVTLIWDPNTEPDLAGYKIHYGTASNDYLHSIDVGDTEICTITDLQPGETYYFAATAYNTAGLESDYSDEVIYTVPL